MSLKRFILLSLVLTVSVVLLLVTWRPDALQTTPRSSFTSSAPLTTQSYVWQRDWNADVQDAVSVLGPKFNRIVFLSRQITWDVPDGRVVSIDADWNTLASCPSVGAAIRISSFPGPFDGASAKLLQKTIRSVLDEASAHQVKLSEIQIDFDAAKSKLEGYRQWIIAAKKEAGPIPVVFTALPSWLSSPAFAYLAKEAGEYVLQVHGLDKPQTLRDPVEICDPAKALVAIDSAGHLGVPFRLALPTYSYVMAFDDKGKYTGLQAEGFTPQWSEGKTLRLAESHPAPLAELTAKLLEIHPPCLTGILWYRLPNEGDRLNWSWTTLHSVMQGKTPTPAKLDPKLELLESGERQLVLYNTGQQDATPPFKITVSWSQGDYTSADGLSGFQISRQGNQIQWTCPNDLLRRVRPNTGAIIGWIRLNNEKDLKVYVE